jgi:Zn-dependent protease with chaperone function
MSARTSFLASAVLAALPLVAALMGLSRLLNSWGDNAVVKPIAGVCQLAYELTLSEAGHLGVAFLVAIIFVFSGRALYVLWRDWKRTAKVRQAMLSLPAQASEVIDRLQPQSPRKARIDVIVADSPFALTVGYLRPRIVISSVLVELLEESELEAVIRHEFVHASRLDPLRVLLSDFFRAGLPFVPVLSYLL